ncbi:hypothetical protein [Rhizobium sp. BK376]|uniref:hypothetical protein n=1 Tax=Rhizobium sp. BK376 TaxID=2512149 RepID=UPI00104F9E96|nr:hypothetical protein [Rhizobium sp. BK376]TCR80781.1 hypothetical protein EV561_11358 [Rhizobium sp. BK376]
MSKHPTVIGIEISTIRSLFLKHENRRGRFLLATAIDDLKLPAQDADAFLRKVATAGYIEWSDGAGENSDWNLTQHGLRLMADSLGARISRQRAQLIIDEVVRRARAINADPDRLARVKELRLFGSALDAGRDDYGDVDIEAEIEIRRFPEDEVARAHAKVAAQVPRSWRDHFIRRFRAEEGYDSRRVFAALKASIKDLSLSKDATKTLGCEFRCIYRFDLDSGKELAPDDAITPRTTAPPKSAEEILPSSLPERSIIAPIGLIGADEKLRSSTLKISMESLALTEAKVWLGKEKPDGSRAATDTRKNPDQRFAGAQFFFDDWRDPSLTGLELFQRTLDWAAHYDLPISKIGRKFSLRTYQGGRTANFHALIVQRVADRVDAHLVLDKPQGGRSTWHLGGSTFTTPRMIAAHHALAVALARMLDETGLTGQTTFTAEFDLTGEKRNSYPVLPNLSSHSARLRKALSKISFPQAIIDEARDHMDDYESNLPLNRQVEVMAASMGKKDKEPVALASAMLGETWKEDEIEDPEDPGQFYPGEEDLWDATDPVMAFLQESLKELPGCLRLSISHTLPVPA